MRETGAKPSEFLEFITPDDITGVSPSDPTWLKCNGQRYLMALRRGLDGCHFLDKKTRHCSIYASRPILCRLYPFKLQETRDGAFRGFTLHSDVGCPRFRDGVVDTHALYQLYLEDDKHQQDYQDLVRVFNARRDKDKKPEDFVKMFIVEAVPQAVRC